MRIIGYERVSTARQGASGLGIEAQRQAIDGFVAQRGATLIARRGGERPQPGPSIGAKLKQEGDRLLAFCALLARPAIPAPG